MASYYSLIQYFPDEPTDERINIGAVVFGDGRVRTHFLQNWERVRKFAGREIEFLKDFAHSAKKLDEDTVRRLSGHSMNAIQFSQISASLLNADALLLDVAATFLVDPAPSAQGYRGRADAVKLLRSEVRKALIEKLGGYARLLVKPHLSVDGKHGPHQFDVTVANGHPIFSAQAISFEVPDSRKLAKEVDATAWMVEDVRKADDHFPIAIFALPPRQPNSDTQATYSRAGKIFNEFKASLIPGTPGLPQWAEKMANEIPSLH